MTRIWQRNYYDHIIRDDGSLDRIRQYIAQNPLKWSLDRNNPHRVILSNRKGDDNMIKDDIEALA